MLPDRIYLQPLAGTRIYFSGHAAPDHDHQSNVQHLGANLALCLKPVELNGRDFSAQRPPVTDLWVALPLAVINAARAHPTLRVRGFATVALYRRANGSLAYGLEHAQDLEMQTAPGEPWKVVLLTGVMPRKNPVAVGSVQIPAATRADSVAFWLAAYQTPVQMAYRNLLVYKRLSNHPRYADFCQTVQRVRTLLLSSQLPTAEDLNIIYYVLGSWRTGEAPRHLRSAYEPSDTQCSA